MLLLGSLVLPRGAAGFTVTSLGERITFDVAGATAGFEFNRFTDGGDATNGGWEEIHFVAEYNNGRRMTVQAGVTPTPSYIDPTPPSGGSTYFTPRQAGLLVGMPSFAATEYQDFTSTSWTESSWPTNPGPMSIALTDKFYKNSPTNVVRVSFFGLWANDPTNYLRSGNMKQILIFVWSFDDWYGYTDITDMPWEKGMRDRVFKPRRRQPPDGCGTCRRVGLPSFRVNTAVLNPVVRDTDFAWSGLGPDIDLARTYSGDPTQGGMFGNGWRFAYETFLDQNTFGHELFLGDGRQIPFNDAFVTNGSAIYQPWRGFKDELYMTSTPSAVFYDFRERATENVHHFEGVQFVWPPPVGHQQRMWLRHITDRNSNRVNVAWTNDGIGYWWITSITDAVGRAVRFQCTASGLCTNMIVPNGGSAVYTYDGSRNLTSSRDLYGNLTTYSYDGGNRLVSMSTEGRTWTFNYDGYRLLSTVDPLGYTNAYRLTDAFYPNRITTVTDARGLETRQASHYGAAWGETPPDWAQTYTIRDDRDPAVVHTNARGFATRFTHDARQNLTSVTGPDGAVTTFGYDARDHVTAVTNALGGVARFRVRQRAATSSG